MPSGDQDMTIIWRGITIHVSISDEQQRAMIDAVMNILSQDTNETAASRQFLIEEEQHLRQLLIQYHQNRRILELQKAKYGSGEVPLIIENQLNDINQQIRDVSERIDALVTQRHP